MSLRFIPGTFGTIGAGGSIKVNLSDSANLAGALQSVKTTGQTRIDPLSTHPDVGQKWEILSIAFQSYLAISNPNGNALYGLLGRLIAGIFIDPRVDTTSGAIPFQQLPGDDSISTTLWDGSADRVPPQFTSANFTDNTQQLLLVNSAITLPIPKELTSSQIVNVGLWLTPSIIGTTTNVGDPVELAVMQSSYTIAIDDNL